MIRFYFVRHGETLSNLWHTLQGWSDTPLTKKGIHQGEMLGLGFSDIDFIKIYTSTSERAYDTACYARGNKKIDITMCKGLKEMNFGMLETKPNDFKGCETYLERIQYRWREVGGENLEDVCERMGETMNTILEENKDQDGNVLCVSHGIAILGALYKADKNLYEECLKKEVRFDNCSVTKIMYENGNYNIESVNSLDYVKKGETDYEKNHK